MAFDFPSPANPGDVYAPPGGPAWQYDGEKWRGGAMAGPQKEQFFDLSGLTFINITVPTWAKACQITGAIYTVSPVIMRYSLDGSTFLNGASDYAYGGASHSLGTNAYATAGATNTTHMFLTASGDNASYPHHFTADINLTRPDTAKLLGGLKTYSKFTDSAAATLQRTIWYFGHLGTIPAGSALAIKALRITRFDGVAFGAGSHFHVRWLGDDAQVPVSNAIADCPSDGGEYVRVNGVWRLKEQSFDIAGVSTFDFNVPVGAKQMQLDGFFLGTGVSAPGMRISTDGTTFLAGAADYQMQGPTHNTGSAGFLGQAVYTSNFMQFGTGGDTPIGQSLSVHLNLTRASGQTFQARTYTKNFDAGATSQYRTSWFSAITSAGGAPPISIKALRFMNGSSGSLTAAEARLNVRWMY